MSTSALTIPVQRELNVLTLRVGSHVNARQGTRTPVRPMESAWTSMSAAEITPVELTPNVLTCPDLISVYARQDSLARATSSAKVRL